MTDELVQDREQSGDDPDQPLVTVQASPQQLLRGSSVGISSNRVVCLGCGATLEEGRAVTVYGYRGADSETWNLRRCYCTDCAPTAIGEPTLGVTELLVRAWLGSVALPRTRTHELCLTEIEVVDASPATEGSEP
ncbi:MAG: hypothetical protein U5K28_10210 [Halobacteriales archaeon]|nr:hypothetical protein [Halobacteriales archaeon]